MKKNFKNRNDQRSNYIANHKCSCGSSKVIATGIDGAFHFTCAGCGKLIAGMSLKTELLDRSKCPLCGSHTYTVELCTDESAEPALVFRCISCGLEYYNKRIAEKR